MNSPLNFIVLTTISTPIGLLREIVYILSCCYPRLISCHLNSVKPESAKRYILVCICHVLIIPEGTL